VIISSIKNYQVLNDGVFEYLDDSTIKTDNNIIKEIFDFIIYINQVSYHAKLYYVLIKLLQDKFNDKYIIYYKNKNIINFNLENYQFVIDKYLYNIIVYYINDEFDISKLLNIDKLILFLIFININNENLINDINIFLNLLNECLNLIKKINSINKEDRKKK